MHTDGAAPSALSHAAAETHAGARAVAAAVGLALVVASGLRFGVTTEGVVSASFLVVLTVLSVVDVEEHRLPNRIVVPGIVAALVAVVALAPDRAIEAVVAAAGAAAFLALPLVVDRSGIGMGDIKLAVLLGSVLGKAVLTALLVASLGVGLVALVLLALHGRSAAKRAIPFGPFLAVGAAVAVLTAGPLGS